MKIIGKTTAGYIVEATGDELAKCAGERSEYGITYDARNNSRHPFAKVLDHNGFRLGAEIKVSDAYDYLAKLKENDKSCRGAAKMLHTMADMIDSAMPTTIVPPDPEAEPGT